MDRGRRYKERGLQFASSEDSRALRAVESQAGRKARRDALLSRRRMYELDESTGRKETSVLRKLGVADVQPVITTKRSEKELALQRYKDLLKWKEERRKKLTMERRKRKPSFKTGLFQPDQPKFLVSDDVKVTDSRECTPSKPTPFKYLQRSSSKYGFTPGTSTYKTARFCTGIAPVATMLNVPKFNLRTTPTSAGGRAAILSNNKHPEQKENFPGPSCAPQTTGVKSQARKKSKAAGEVEMKRILRGRSKKCLKAATENEDLGVKVLPRTPKACQQNLMDCKKAKSALPSLGYLSLSSGYSFAPDDFSFTFKKNTGSKESRSEEVEKLQEQFNADSTFSEEEKNDAKAQECADFRAPERNRKGNEEDLICKAVSGDASSTLEHSRKEEQVYVSASRKSSRRNRTSYFNDLEATNQLTRSSDLVDEIVVVETADKTKSTDTTEDDKLEGDLKREEITNMELVKETISMTDKVGSVKDFDVGNCSPAYKTKLRDDFEISNAEKDTDPSSPEMKCSVSMEQETQLPLRRRSTRNSKRLSSCADTILTPLMTRLRPRTPCSRSTRRSLSAHCDSIFEVKSTPSKPSSTRKRRSRYSGSMALKRNDINEPLTPLKLGEEILNTLAQEFSGGIDKASFLMKENHVIEEENEDQAMISALNECKEDEHILIAQPEPLKEAFMVQTPKQDDIVTPCGSRRRGKVSWMVHDSPYINTEKRSTTRRSEVPADMRGLFDDIPTDGSPLPAHLIPLLAEGRKIQQDMSPIQPSVGVNSPGVEGDQSSSGEEQICTNLMALLELSAAPHERTDSPDIDVWGEESLDKGNDSIQTDPVSTTDAIDLLSAPVTRRKSSRISLLPGMKNSPLTADKVSAISKDLISWETPVTNARKMFKERVATPCRRSQRLSKICPE